MYVCVCVYVCVYIMYKCNVYVHETNARADTKKSPQRRVTDRRLS